MTGGRVVGRTYEDALRTLNSLQSGWKLLSKKRAAEQKLGTSDMSDMLRWSDQAFGGPGSLDRFRIVHIAGTKGKGTACSYIDTLLSAHQKETGFPRRIGLYTSPHLLLVRERIRIDSKPITEEKFATYFFQLWEKLRDTSSMPSYFRFLTLLAMHSFLQEKVDAVILETGVGGEFDSTNIVKRPVATGITALGMDHVVTLGNSIESISWHKAGIFKPGAAAFSVPQKEEAMNVLHDRAQEKGVSLKVVQEDPRLQGVLLNPDEEFQRVNASLAIRLSESLLSDGGYKSLTIKMIKELERTRWRGRFEKLTVKGINWFLDGAHTEESLDKCAHWFTQQSSSGCKILIFNQQSTRSVKQLLYVLQKALANTLTIVIFCTNMVHADRDEQLDFVNNNKDRDELLSLSHQKYCAKIWESFGPGCAIHVCTSVQDAINLSQETAAHNRSADVLVTGSLHLVGMAIHALEER